MQVNDIALSKTEGTEFLCQPDLLAMPFHELKKP